MQEVQLKRTVEGFSDRLIDNCRYRQLTSQWQNNPGRKNGTHWLSLVNDNDNYR